MFTFFLLSSPIFFLLWPLVLSEVTSAHVSCACFCSWPARSKTMDISSIVRFHIFCVHLRCVDAPHGILKSEAGRTLVRFASPSFPVEAYSASQFPQRGSDLLIAQCSRRLNQLLSGNGNVTTLCDPFDSVFVARRSLNTFSCYDTTSTFGLAQAHSHFLLSLTPPLSFHICITDVSFHFAYATFTTDRPRRTSLDRCSRTSTSSSKPDTTRHQSRTRRKSGTTSDHRGKHEDAAARDCNGRYVMSIYL